MPHYSVGACSNVTLYQAVIVQSLTLLVDEWKDRSHGGMCGTVLMLPMHINREAWLAQHAIHMSY